METIEYGVGEKAKRERHTDAHESIDEFLLSTKGEGDAIAEAMKSIGQALTSNTPAGESPSKKKLRRMEEMSAVMKSLLEEKKMVLDMGGDTTDVDVQIARLKEQRNLLSAPPQAMVGGPAVINLANSFENAGH